MKCEYKSMCRSFMKPNNGKPCQYELHDTEGETVFLCPEFGRLDRENVYKSRKLEEPRKA